MSHLIRWALLCIALAIVGAWPAAAAPVVLVGAGAAVVIAKIPGVVLALAAVALYLRHRHTPRTA